MVGKKKVTQVSIIWAEDQNCQSSMWTSEAPWPFAVTQQTQRPQPPRPEPGLVSNPQRYFSTTRLLFRNLPATLQDAEGQGVGEEGAGLGPTKQDGGVQWRRGQSHPAHKKKLLKPRWKHCVIFLFFIYFFIIFFQMESTEIIGLKRIRFERNVFEKSGKCFSAERAKSTDTPH